MVNLGSTDFYFAVPSMPRDDFEAFSSRLFDLWEAQVSQEVPLDDYALSLEIEEGSVKGSGNVKAGLIAVGLFVSQYGSIVQGLETMHKHIVQTGSYLSEKAHELLGSENPAPEVRKRSGTLGQIQRLFEKVHRRQITAEEAMAEVEKLLGDEATTAPDFMKRLNESLRDGPLLPKQLFLSPAGELCEPAKEMPEKRQPSGHRQPSPGLPPANQFRVEIWRESKRGKKHIKIVAI